VNEAAKYFNFSVDPRDSVGQFRYHFSLRDGIGISTDLGGRVHDFNFSLDQADPKHRFIGNALAHQ
jgi:hypothetical protein